MSRLFKFITCLLLVEEREGRRGEEWRGANVVMRQARQDRKRVTTGRPAPAHPHTVPLPATEQLEDLDVVARWGHIGVGGGEHRRHLEASNLFGEVEWRLEPGGDIVQERGEV